MQITEMNILSIQKNLPCIWHKVGISNQVDKICLTLVIMRNPEQLHSAFIHMYTVINLHSNFEFFISHARSQLLNLVWQATHIIPVY